MHGVDQTLVSTDNTPATIKRAVTNDITDLLSHAEAVANHLAQYSRALASVCVSNDEQRKTRLAALHCLMEVETMPRQTVRELTGISPHGLRNLEELRLIEADRSNVSLSRHGENFLTLLYMFTKDVNGVESREFLDLLKGMTAGGYNAEPVAKLMAGSLKREARRTRRETSKEDAASLELAKPDRDLATERIQMGILTLVRGGIASDLESDLRSASTDLTEAIVQQRRVSARVTRENFTLPQGRKYVDLEKSLKAHSWTSFHQILSRHRNLFFRHPQHQARPHLTEDLRTAFHRVREPLATTVVTKSTKGEIPVHPAMHLVIKDLQGAPDGAGWHDVASTSRSYLWGIKHASTTPPPREFRRLAIELVFVDGKQVHTKGILHAPLVVIRRKGG